MVPRCMVQTILPVDKIFLLRKKKDPPQREPSQAYDPSMYGSVGVLCKSLGRELREAKILSGLTPVPGPDE